jgi:CRP-like cAMP-binding protein
MPKQPESSLDPETILSEVALFSRLDRRDLRKVAQLCVPRSFAAGELIVQEGEMGLGLFLLTAGRVEVFKGDGDEALSLGFLGSGDVLGEMAVLDDRPRSASAVAVEPTDCLLITRDSFSTLVEEEPGIAWWIVPALTERIRKLDQQSLADAERRRQEKPRAETEAAAEAAAPESSEPPDDEDEDESDTIADIEEATMRFFRAQYALMMGSLTGLRGMIRACEKAMATMADESRLRNSDRIGDLLEELPRGCLEAMRTALKESEEVPEEMADSFREHLKREGED